MRKSWTALAVAAALGVVGAPAGAETWTHRDSDHDVILSTPQHHAPPTKEPAPYNARADVVRVSVHHASPSVRVDVVTRSRRAVDTLVDLRTGHGRYRVIWSMFLETPSLSDLLAEPGTDDEVPCGGLSVRKQRARHTVVVTVPRACIGDPDWVRVGVRTAQAQKGDSGGGAFLDDALQTGGFGHADLGPRVYADRA